MQARQAQVVPETTRGPFDGLSPIERRTLVRWLAAARRGGIETVEDLGARRWPGLETETVIGVFRSGHLLASWLIVGRGGTWAVASCGDSVVSGSVSSLAEALALVYSPELGVAAARTG